MADLELKLTKKQKAFIDADADEVLYGGAAGGGKSYGQMVDALLYALKYPKSKQLIMRRTFPELDKTMIRIALEMYPQALFKLSTATRTGKFVNGSIIDFGYCDAENDVYRYQGGEWDVIRIDEVTHFTQFQYLYLKSRCRGANSNPKQMKLSTNPGGIGHSWVKDRFIDPAVPGEKFTVLDSNGEPSTRVFIPALLKENKFLLESDPQYERRLMDLPEKERKALLEGDWNIFDGIRFTSFSRETHVIDPFEIPRGWRRYRTIDYGLDRLACLWAAISPDNDIYIYKEYCESNLIISDAAKNIRDRTNEEIYCTLAPDDLWSRDQYSGKARNLIFADNDLPLVKVSRDRAAGWAAVDELLKVRENGRPRIYFFRNCLEIIKCLPQLQIDPKKPDDVMTEPHDITHAPDALRNLAVYFTSPAKPEEEKPRIKWTQDMRDDYYNASREEKQVMIARWGVPN